MKHLHWIALMFITIFSSHLLAQIPGDGIPDAYYYGIGGSIFTSAGMVEVPAHSLLLDTDGVDLVAFFLGGADVTEECVFCDGMNLPGADALANTSTWTVGYSAGSTQWIRTNPLSGDGFRGVVGVAFVDGSDAVQQWPNDVPPFLDFPEAGEGLFQAPDFCADRVFEDTNGNMRHILYATDSGDVGHIDVSGSFAGVPQCVPEPGTGSMAIALLGLMALVARRRP